MIVPMKKATLFALKSDREALLLSLQRCGELMIIPPEEGGQPGTSQETEQQVSRAESALQFLSKYGEKKGLFAQRPTVNYEQFIRENEKTAELMAQAKEISDRIAALKTEAASQASLIEQLAPWLELDVPLDRLAPTRSVRFHTGYADPSSEEPVKAAAEALGAEVRLLGHGGEGRAVFLAAYAPEDDDLVEAVKAAGLLESAPPHVAGLAKDASAACRTKIAECEKQIGALEEKAKELAAKRADLEILCDSKNAESQRAAAPSSETDATFYLEAWVRSDRLDRVKKAVERVTDAFELTFADPIEGEQPPTVTKNSKFITQFETITDMFARPMPGRVDPNPVAGVWYWIIFGLMMGDAGYGLLMAIVIFAFIKLKKPTGDFGKLVNVLFLSSIPTIFWGIMFGSYFGETWNPIIFAPLDNPVPMLIFTLVIGVLHIFSGMALKMYESVKAGRPLDAIFDQLSWMIIIVGCGLLFLPATQTAGMVLAIAGALVVLLTAGRANKGFGKITGGLLGLYSITSYLADILSYSRILALSLATGVVGMVMNMLAGMVQGSIIGFVFSLAIYFVGHAFNLAMGLLSAYVHDSRLQYIEFFNKFYDGGGYEFRPLAVTPSHVDVVDDAKA